MDCHLFSPNYHYENLPMQYTDFSAVKDSSKKNIIFLYFLLRTLSGYTVEPPRRGFDQK